MSTRIDDLPMPHFDDERLHIEPERSNIKADIVKKVRFSEELDIIDEGFSLKNEITEENMFLFVLFKLSCFFVFWFVFGLVFLFGLVFCFLVSNPLFCLFGFIP